jgi:hypothetical protein
MIFGWPEQARYHYQQYQQLSADPMAEACKVAWCSHRVIDDKLQGYVVWSSVSGMACSGQTQA